MALKDKPATPFRVPAGIKLIRVSASSGTRAGGEGGGTILEAFKPGTGAAGIRAAGACGRRPAGRVLAGSAPGAQRAVGVGTGGLY